MTVRPPSARSFVVAIAVLAATGCLIEIVTAIGIHNALS